MFFVSEGACVFISMALGVDGSGCLCACARTMGVTISIEKSATAMQNLLVPFIDPITSSP
jgi:hypothetical protein